MLDWLPFIIYVVIMYFLLGKIGKKILPTDTDVTVRPDATPEQARYETLMNKICTLSDTTHVDFFRIACEEMGFGYTKRDIGYHYLNFVKTRELPTYVWSFLDKEEDDINRAWGAKLGGSR